MRHKCGTACFGVFIVFCLLLYLAELGLQVWVAVGLFADNLQVWFALLLGFMTVPLLTAQLVSCQWAWPEKGGLSSACLTLLPHLTCVAVPWRYARLILTCEALDTKKELSQVCLLRVFLAFSSSLPIILLETYLLLNSPPGEMVEQYVLYCALGVTLVSVCWSLATHRKRSKDYNFLATLISWPGTVFRITWRFGELTARILILALFAGLHSFWILLVLALHWLTMFTWSLTEQVVQTATSGLTLKAIKTSLMSSYVHVFCYLNISQNSSRARLILFYVMICLENTVLLVLWFLYDTRTYLHVPMAVVIGASYVFAFISALLYYNCFHVKSAQVVQRGAEVMYMQPCMNCRPHCCLDKRGGDAAEGTFHPAWWIEVKENTEANPNTYDMLLPSELKRNGLDKRSQPAPNCKQVKTSDPRYWMDLVGSQTDSSSAVYESITRYQLPDRLKRSTEVKLEDKRLSKISGQENEAYTWDNYDIQLSHAADCVNRSCQGQCQRPLQISDSGISATTSDQSGSRILHQRSDASLLYTSDTSDFTSTRTSLSYLDPLRIHQLSMYSDAWSTTSSSYGQTSSESACRDLGMYLPMLTHLNHMAGADHRSPAPLPAEVPTVVSLPQSTPDVHYDHVPSNMSQTSGGRRARPKMGHRACSRNQIHGRRRISVHRKRAVPCGVAGKLHRRHHSDASDIRSRSSVAASTTDSYDGSQSDWDLEDRISSVHLTATQSDLDFSVCGEYPYTETDNEYVQPTSHPDLSKLPQIIQKLDESGRQIGFAC